MKIDLKIKNYRCFSDEKPAVISIEDGFTALVGPNNAGKSSVLRFLFEFRSVFNFLKNVQDYNSAIAGVSRGFGPLPPDPTELFYNGNGRPIEIDMQIDGVEWVNLPPPYKMSGIGFTITIPRGASIQSTTRLKDPRKLLTVPSKQVKIIDDVLTVVLEDHKYQPQLDLKPVFEAFDILSRTIYIGAFRNALNIGEHQSYFDLQVGQAFMQAWHNYKAGPLNAQSEAARKVEKEIARLLGVKDIQINTSPKGQAIKLLIDDRSLPLDAVGSGVSQMILTLANAAIKKPSFVLLDEPELNLHPSLQLDFLTSLASYATNGVIFATHSIGLARSSADTIYSLQRSDGGPSEIRLFDELSNLPEFMGELGYSGYRDLGGAKILLVEGTTDVRSIQQFLRKLRKDRNIILVPLGGGSLINAESAHELEELKRLSPDVAVIIDSERNAEGDPLDPPRQAFVSNCEKFGFTTMVLKRRAIENYFTDRAVKASLGPSYQALTEYQERRSLPRPWAKSKNWRVAHEMSPDELKGTDLGLFLESL